MVIYGYLPYSTNALVGPPGPTKTKRRIEKMRESIFVCRVDAISNFPMTEE